MGKDAKRKGKGNSQAKSVKGGKCSAEEQYVKEADAELVEGVWPNQEPLSLSARFFFFA